MNNQNNNTSKEFITPLEHVLLDYPERYEEYIQKFSLDSSNESALLFLESVEQELSTSSL